MVTKEPGAAPIAAMNLRTEYLENPLGIDDKCPYLSWQISANERNVLQSAYQIQVAHTIHQLIAGDTLLWDSGKTISRNTTSILYAGPECESRQRYTWRVRVWNQQEQPSSWSEPAWWEMGLLDEKEWTANWIEADWDEDPKAFNPCPFLRRGFTMNKEVVSAKLYITAHGLYEAWMNGQRVGDQVFTPGYTPL